MRLYLINGSPNGRKTLSIVKHLGLDIEICWLDLFGGDTGKPEYLELNPTGLTPTLVDGEFVLYESNAINAYLCDVSSNESLYPKDLKVRADINRWLCWELAQFNKCLGVLSFQLVAKPTFGLGEANSGLVEHYIEDFDRYGAALDKHLEGREFMVGNDWTIADYAIGHIEMFQSQLKVIDWSKYPNLLAFYERLRKNPHWIASAAKNPQEIGRIPSS